MTPARSLRHVLHGVLRRRRRHVGNACAVAGLVLLLGFAAVLLGFALLVRLWKWTTPSGVRALDDDVLTWIQAYHTPRLDGMALEITYLGSSAAVWMTVVIASVLLWLNRHHGSALLLWVAVLGAQLLAGALKVIFDRERPDVFPWRAPHPESASFPSGHAVTAIVLYGTLAYLVVRLEPRASVRRATWAFAALTVVLIGATRLYLGVHYPSDVIAGFFAGLLWASFCALAMEAAEEIRRGRRIGPDDGRRPS